MASEVIACGLDISFAPVLDVDRDTSSIIGDRAFSDQPQLVCDVAGAFIAGMNEAGMAATGKHFPGHGGIVADSHLEAPIDQRSWAELSEHDLVPFVALADQLGGVMPAHITYPEIDPDSVGFSPFWLQQILRSQLGFNGVIFSDDLAMKGADIAGGYVQKAERALSAGCDMILVCNDRAGAQEVLKYMTEQRVSGSDKIAAMLKTQSVSWSQLENDPRRVDTMAQLGLL
jgi:beta-N-acetylhexosaminidase